MLKIKSPRVFNLIFVVSERKTEFTISVVIIALKKALSSTHQEIKGMKLELKMSRETRSKK